MPLFVVEYGEAADSAGIRQRERDAHVGYRRGLGNALVMAGPLLENDAAKTPRGSLVILEAASHDEAEKIAAGDPYLVAGAFSSVEVRGYKMMALNPPSRIPA